MQDFVVAEHVALLRSSQSGFIQELFAESEADGAAAAAGKGRHTTRSAFKLNSVGAQFRKQLQVRCHGSVAAYWELDNPCALKRGAMHGGVPTKASRMVTPCLAVTTTFWDLKLCLAPSHCAAYQLMILLSA